MDTVWDIFSDYLFYLNRSFEVKIHAFVLMSNHYHLILSTPKLNLSEAMMNFVREVSRELNHHGNRINRTFAGRFFRSHIGTYHYYMNCYKYSYLNPIKAGLAEKVEVYKYSTLSGLLGNSFLQIPVEEDQLLFSGNLQRNLNWLNNIPSDEDLESIRLALKKKSFKLRKNASNQPNRLETELL